ncbi:hypothetical protein KVV02_002712, partial [Mortierella alpina]
MVFIVVHGLLAQGGRSERFPQPECTTAQCAIKANAKLDAIDTEIDPCADFYAYAYSSGPFPMDANGTVDKNALFKTLAHLNKMGLGVFSSFSLSIDARGLKRRVLYLSGDEHNGDCNKAAVPIALQSIMDNSGSTHPSSPNSSSVPVYKDLRRWLRAVKYAANFMQKLLAISETNLNNTWSPQSMEEIAAMTPSINWTLFLKKMFPPDIGNTRPIIIASPEYQRNLDTILRSVKPIELQSYFIWETVRQLQSQYQSPDASQKRWRYCIRVVKTELSGLLNTRGEAIKKLIQTVILVGSNPKFQSSMSLHRRYINYTVVPDDYFGNRLRYRIWRLETLFKRMDKGVDRDAFSFPFSRLNLGSMRQRNNIEIPAGMLQPPLFHPDYPDYINLSGIGALIAHELTHHFDGYGRLFDEEGSEVNWWSNVSTTAFYRKAKCFVDQYNNYTVRDKLFDHGGLDINLTMAIP